MQPDLALVAETREWLAKAALDLRAAEFEFTARPPLTADITFHSQQLAEKSMKAFLTWHDQPFRRVHNLLEIGKQCVEIDGTLEAVVQEAATLTDYAWKFRYPGEPEEPSVAEAEQALSLAREAYGAILARLPDEVRR